MTNTDRQFFAINWKDAKEMVESGQLTIIGSNIHQINNQGEYTITADKTRLFKRRHSAATIIFDIIAHK